MLWIYKKKVIEKEKISRKREKKKVTFADKDRNKLK